MKCPNCGEWLGYNNRMIDVEHECNSSSEVLDNEDVVKTGSWVDYTGSGANPNVNLLGVAKKNFGKTSWKEGERTYELTSRGNRASTHRSRQHIEFIELK